MSTQYNDLKTSEELSDAKITPFVFDLMYMLRKIKQTATVQNVYFNKANEKLEIYVFYEKEDFDIEDEITKYFTDWETSYKYFPELFIYPLDMIDNKNLLLPINALEI